jgi:hypothetical protein
MKDFLQKCVYKIQRFARSHFKKGNLNLCLYKHYQEELQVIDAYNLFIYLLFHLLPRANRNLLHC